MTLSNIWKRTRVLRWFVFFVAWFIFWVMVWSSETSAEENNTPEKPVFIEMSPEGRAEFRGLMAALEHLKTRECVGRAEVKSIKQCGPVDLNTGKIMVLPMAAPSKEKTDGDKK